MNSNPAELDSGMITHRRYNENENAEEGVNLISQQAPEPFEIDIENQNETQSRETRLNYFLQQYYLHAFGIFIGLLLLTGLIGKFNSENPLINNDTVVSGILAIILLVIFTTEQTFLVTCGVVSVQQSNVPEFATKVLLPSSLILLTIGTDFPGILKLGPKAVLIFFTGTFGIMLGAIISLLFFSVAGRQLVAGDAWKGMACLAGSWIGGSPNALAMKEVFEVSDRVYSQFIGVDIFGANLWLGLLLFLSRNNQKIDKILKADSQQINQLAEKMAQQQEIGQRFLTYMDVVVIGAISLGGTGICTWIGTGIAQFIQQHLPILSNLSLTSDFFWTLILTTILGLFLSFTKVRNYDGAGASKIGSYLLYFLVATIGLRLDLIALAESAGLLLIGLLWVVIHGVIIFLGGRLVKSPLFLIAVGSQANIGGSATAPVVAAVFHPSLAPVGVLLGVLGYSVGTLCAWLTGLILKGIATGLRL